jgi:acyl-CoA thioester hydrolase
MELKYENATLAACLNTDNAIEVSSMKPFSRQYKVIWADMDPNRHMRHTSYNDFAAQLRVEMFEAFDCPLEYITEVGLGPILFREETKFFREVYLSEQITVTAAIQAMRKDASRWTILHEIFKEDEVKAAQIIVDGAWIDLNKRKLGTPPEEMVKLFSEVPRTEDFEWLEG